MKDDQMDELLIQAARDYNRPGGVPREEMWSGISAARRGSAPRRLGASGARRRVWVWPVVGVAAAALLAVGVMIGRRLERQTITTTTLAAKPAVVKARADTATAASKADPVTKQFERETRKTDDAVRRLAQATDRAVGDRPVAGPPSRRAAEAPSLAYRLVVLRHLAGSEALITSFRSEAKRGEMDTQIAQWSREMLGTTRLLEASAASDDPVMKRLLGDLDLIIAQIAVYAARGTNNPEELDLIEQSINQRGVIAKLRSTMPGAVSSPDGRPATHM